MKKFAYTLTLVLLFCFGSGVAHAKKGFEDFVEAARTARKDGNYLEAARWLLKAYELNQSPIILNNIGKMYEEAGYYRKAYDAYKRVADDPSAPADLRPMNISRMNGLSEKLVQGHVRINNAQEFAEVYVGPERITKDTFAVERATAPGKTTVEFRQLPESTVYVAPIKLTAGRRTELDLAGLKQSATASLTSFDITGLKTVKLNGYTLQGERPNRIKVPPSVYLVELEFNDGSAYERTVTLKDNQSVGVDDFATTFSQTEGASSTSGKKSSNWFRGSAIALGVGLTTAGSLFAYQANSDQKDLLSNTNITMSDAESQWKDNQNKGNLGVGLIGVGVTAVTTGLLWMLLDGEPRPSQGAWEWMPSPFAMPVQAAQDSDRPL